MSISDRNSSRARLIIAGGRDFDTRHAPYMHIAVEAWRDWSEKHPAYPIIISGMARGADTFGVQLAQHYGFDLEKFPADWDTYGKRAGFIRNEAMAHRATHLLAFHDGASRGTAHMIATARRLGLEVTVVHYEPLDNYS